MANYVDGFIVPVPKKNLNAYKKVARIAGKVWKEHGALAYVECIADNVKPGKLTSFPQSVKLKSTEVVFFSWIVYKSKADRNKIFKKVMNDPRITKIGLDCMPFDAKRMVFGAFKTVVSL